MDRDEPHIPTGWASTPLGDILPLSYGKALKSSDRDENGEVEVYGSSGTVGRHNSSLSGPNTIIVGRKGSAGSVHLTNRSAWTIDTAYFTQPPKGLEPTYWYHQLGFLQLGRLDQSTAIPSLSRDNYSKIRVAVPPSREQIRIVEKIDALFAQIDAGEQALAEARAGIARYKKSILKAAVTGALTADWREARRDELEPADALLDRILKARREHWERDQIQKAEAKGKPLTVEAWKKKYKEPVAPETEGLPDLPEGWVWASPEQLKDASVNALSIGPFGSNLKVSDYAETGVPLIFVRNIRTGEFPGSTPKFISAEKAQELASHSASPGDVLITKMGDPPGAACVYPGDQRDAIITADCMKFTPNRGIKAAYVAYFVNSMIGALQIKTMTKGVAQQKVSLQRFRTFAIALPSTIEQGQICELLERELVRIARLDWELGAQLKRAKALRQSVLKAAFEGRLVPQDPDDEPASVLLERIRAERAAQPKPQRRRKSKPRAKA